jgi:hypothetical protein
MHVRDRFIPNTTKLVTHFIKVLHQLGMFIGNMFLNERGSSKQFLTRLTSEFAFILLLDMRFCCLRQFPKNFPSISVYMKQRTVAYSSYNLPP